MEALRARAASRLSLTAGQVVYLDGVRGLAAGLVLINHIQRLTGAPPHIFGIDTGRLGVTLFFLVSGFLIDRSARGHKRDYGLREFLIERLARIYVCLVPALVFTAALVSALIHRPDFVGERHAGWWQFFGNLFMLQGYPAFQLARRAGFDAPWFVQPYALAEPYWTIPIELALYVAFGIAWFVLAKRTAKLTSALLLAFVITLLPVLYHAATGWGECLSLVWLLGVLGSRWFHRQEQRGEANPRALLAIIGSAGLLLGLRLLSRGGDFYDLQKALFLGVMLLGGLQLSAHVTWLASEIVRLPAAFFANTSYALYLTHNVIVGWAVMAFGKALDVGHWIGLFITCHVCAWLFWWMFDRHHKRVAAWLKEARLPGTTSAGCPPDGLSY